MSRIYLDRNWKFVSEYKDGMESAALSGGEVVDIPHSVSVTPFNYFDESVYQMLSCYQKTIDFDAAWAGKVVYLTFEGVAHRADVYVNGKHLICNKNGYNAFTIDITEALHEGENLITVKCDSREDKINQPPFGYVVDYMTYGGIYRDVYLEVKEKEHIIDAFYQPKPIFDSTAGMNREQISSFTCEGHLTTVLSISDEAAGLIKGNNLTVKQTLDGQTVVEVPLTSELKFTAPISKVYLWDVESPKLYKVETQLISDGKVLDTHTFEIGFRTAEFRSDGFYLNGRKFRIRGLNRHQSYPYVGYAMPDSMQREDARILKEELGVNAVRTSHYSQAHSFTNECDRLGLLQVTEFPGWQHIGDDEWKEVAKENVRQMVTEFRNHPSIILWGVRINESADDEEFYKATNAICHELDETRQTGGTKAGTKMQTFEDVYAYNDFIHSGDNRGCHKKSEVVPKDKQDMPYLVTEYNGHMYPTKNFDDEEHRRDHMLRHARVLNDIAGESDIAGSFGWCMFDYNTHKDFGSGDRICYHGVMDMFRNPKFAASVYACENPDLDVLLFTSSMDVGEHPACNRGQTYILSNMDSVKMYKNGKFLHEYFPSDSEYSNLTHGPILMTRFVEEDIKEQEGYNDRQAEAAKGLLNYAALNGYDVTPGLVKNALKCIFAGLDASTAVPLFQKYVGDWGGESKEYTIEGYKDGKVVKSATVGAVKSIHLEATVSCETLVEDKTYDVASIRIRALDQYGNLVPYYQEAVVATVDGPLEAIGPQVITLRGGMGGMYVKTTGTSGKAKVTLLAQNIEKAEEINFTIEVK